MWGCLAMVNISLNIKKNLSYIFLSEWKSTSNTILPSSVILFVFYNMSNFLRWLNDILCKLDIDFGAKSTTSYGYVLTLDGGALSWKYVKLFFCHDLLCKHKLFLFSMHLDNEIVIFKVSCKNVNEIDIWEWETNVFET